jgi:alanine racemase
MAGYVRALAEVGLTMEFPGVRLTESDVSEEGGRAAFDRLWRRGRRPTALVAMSDLIAVGALEAALQSGLAVPEQLSIIGFDDIPEARWIRPALSTVRQPAREKGRVAAELLISLLDGSGAPRYINLETELINRASVARAPGA